MVHLLPAPAAAASLQGRMERRGTREGQLKRSCRLRSDHPSWQSPGMPQSR